MNRKGTGQTGLSQFWVNNVFQLQSVMKQEK